MAERVLGPEHPDTLTNRHNLANFTGYAGDAPAARDQFAALLRVRERVYRRGLARHRGGQVQPGLLDRACRGRGRRQGPVRRTAPHPRAHVRPRPPRYPSYAGGTRVLDRVRRGRGRRQDQFAALLASYEGVLGPEHPETLAIWYQLAHWTALAGDDTGPATNLRQL